MSVKINASNSMNAKFETNKKKFSWRIIKRGKNVMNLCSTMAFALSFSAMASGFGSSAHAEIPVVTDGGVNEGIFTHDGSTATSHVVNLASDYVKINYDTYNVSSDSFVNINSFNGGGTYVAKINGNGGRSLIDGTINGAGVNVFLMNGAGITFGAGSQVNVGSLIATTADSITKDGDEYTFEGLSDGAGDIINNGDLIASDGGFAILAAPYVENNGFIQADLGTVSLGSTDVFTVNLGGGDLISYGLSEETLAKVGVTNTGTLQAHSGTINISATLASDIVQSVVNLDGVIDADAFDTESNGGEVLIAAADDVNFNDVEISTKAGLNGNGGRVKTEASGLITFSEDASIVATSGSTSGDGARVSITANGDGAILMQGYDIDASSANGERGGLYISNGNFNESFTIADGAGAGETETNTLHEEGLESISQNGTNVTLFTSGSITLEDLSDGELTGGSGDVNFFVGDTPGGNEFIKFNDTNDTISTSGGDIRISMEGGDIDVGNLKITNTGAANDYSSIIQVAAAGSVKTKSLTNTAQIDFSEGGAVTFNSEIFVNSYAGNNVFVDGAIIASNNNTAPTANTGAITQNTSITLSGGVVEVTGDINADSKFELQGLDQFDHDINFNTSLDITARENAILSGNLSATTDLSALGADAGISTVNTLTVTSNLGTTELKGDLAATTKVLRGNAIGSSDDDLITVNKIDITHDNGTSLIASGKTTAITDIDAGDIVERFDTANSVSFAANQGASITILDDITSTTDINMGSSSYSIVLDNDLTIIAEDGGEIDIAGDLSSTIEITSDNVEGVIISNNNLNVEASTANKIDITGNLLASTDISFVGEDADVGTITAKTGIYADPGEGGLIIDGNVDSIVNIGKHGTSEIDDSSANIILSGNGGQAASTTITGDVNAELNIDEHGVYIASFPTHSGTEVRKGNSVGANIGATGDIKIGGDVTASLTEKIKGSFENIGNDNLANLFYRNDADTRIVSNSGNIDIDGSVESSILQTVDASGEEGPTEKRIVYGSFSNSYVYAEGSVDIGGNISSDLEVSSNKDLLNYVNVYSVSKVVSGSGGVIINGDALSSTNVIIDPDKVGVFSVSKVEIESDGDVKIDGILSATSDADNQLYNFESLASIVATGDITLNDDVADPVARANVHLVQQRESGTDGGTLDNPKAELVLDGASITFASPPPVDGGGSGGGDSGTGGGTPAAGSGVSSTDNKVSVITALITDTTDSGNNGTSSANDNSIVEPASGSECDYMNCDEGV